MIIWYGLCGMVMEYGIYYQAGVERKISLSYRFVIRYGYHFGLQDIISRDWRWEWLWDSIRVSGLGTGEQDRVL